MSDTRITIHADSPGAVISPLVHGHFAEHLGRCCYDGLWVGTDSPIPNEDGFRTDVLNALATLGVPQLRWPGGCFADSYHWRDGIGPRSSRPVVLGESCGLHEVENNHLGTHEFIALCRRIGAEPYLAGNVGSGSPRELREWVHYCNGTQPTTIVKERIANGHADSMNVKYWGVGNENWACGGNYDADDYAKEFRRYATFIKQTDPSVELVACGDNSGNPDWNLHLIETLRHDMGLLDHLSLHRYWGAGHAVDFTEEEFYLAMRGGELIEADIRHANALLQGIGGRKKVGIAFDEWGLWHPQANGKSLYEAPSTQRDAVAAAHALDVFQRNADTISMANIAQIVNVLQALIQTSEDKMWLTPTYHTFALYAPHRGATSLPVDLSEVATRKTAATQRHWPESSFGAGEVALVSASASRQADVVHVSVSNRHYTEEMTVQIALRGASAGQASAQVLTADAPNAHNTHDNPARAKVGYLAATVENRVVTVTLPASSVATVSVVVSGA